MEIRKRKLNFANRKFIGGNGNENRTALSGETDTEMEFPFPANMEFRFRFDVHDSIQYSHYLSLSRCNSKKAHPKTRAI
jgi:hypothetical protein